jgi:hypothetical protein
MLCKACVNTVIDAGRLGQDDANEYDSHPDDLDQIQTLAEPEPGEKARRRSTQMDIMAEQAST